MSSKRRVSRKEAPPEWRGNDPRSRALRAALQHLPSAPLAVQVVQHLDSTPLFQDPQGYKIWAVLLRRHPDGSFAHSALESVPGTNAEERQTCAITQLFETAYHATYSPKAVTTRREAEAQRDSFRMKAEMLRADARAWLEPGLDKADDGVLRDPIHDDCYGRLMEASVAYEEMADETYATDIRFAVERHRADKYVRWSAVTIANRARALFGSPLYKITATLVSTAFGLTIEPRAVRHWCTHLANKGSKNGP
jgi:hypothetical protein